jgi:hypothetical protein
MIGIEMSIKINIFLINFFICNIKTILIELKIYKLSILIDFIFLISDRPINWNMDLILKIKLFSHLSIRSRQ